MDSSSIDRLPSLDPQFKLVEKDELPNPPWLEGRNNLFLYGQNGKLSKSKRLINEIALPLLKGIHKIMKPVLVGACIGYAASVLAPHTFSLICISSTTMIALVAVTIVCMAIRAGLVKYLRENTPHQDQWYVGQIESYLGTGHPCIAMELTKEIGDLTLKQQQLRVIIPVYNAQLKQEAEHAIRRGDLKMALQLTWRIEEDDAMRLSLFNQLAGRYHDGYRYYEARDSIKANAFFDAKEVILGIQDQVLRESMLMQMLLEHVRKEKSMSYQARQEFINSRNCLREIDELFFQIEALFTQSIRGSKITKEEIEEFVASRCSSVNGYNCNTLPRMLDLIMILECAGQRSQNLDYIKTQYLQYGSQINAEFAKQTAAVAVWFKGKGEDLERSRQEEMFFKYVVDQEKTLPALVSRRINLAQQILEGSDLSLISQELESFSGLEPSEDTATIRAHYNNIVRYYEYLKELPEATQAEFLQRAAGVTSPALRMYHYHTCGETPTLPKFSL